MKGILRRALSFVNSHPKPEQYAIAIIQRLVLYTVATFQHFARWRVGMLSILAVARAKTWRTQFLIGWLYIMSGMHLRQMTCHV